MNVPLVDIHTHRLSQEGIRLHAEGVHPWRAETVDPDALEPLTSQAQAVGEIGLDFARPVDRQRQMRLFEAQLARAEQAGLPVVLHCVKAFEPVMTVLAGYRLPAVIFHGFIGSTQQAARAYACGYYLSFGERTFRSPKTVEVLRTAPAGRIFLETDDNPMPLARIYCRAAELRGTTFEELAGSIYENYRLIFCP